MAQKRICQICELPAYGTHYGAIACSGCKSFFRRTMVSKSRYPCQGGYGDCPTAVQKCTEYRCRACRFKKCLDVGMRLKHKGRSAKRSTVDLNLPPQKSNKQMGTAARDSGFNKTIMKEADDFCRGLLPEISDVEIIASVTDAAFGDQASCWSAHMNNSESALQEVITVTTKHRSDFVDGLEIFLNLLSGRSDLLGNPRHKDIWTRWKTTACAMIHYAPFMTNGDPVIQTAEVEGKFRETLDERQEPICMLDVAVRSFARRFWASLRDAGLRRVERYILIAVIMFEPVNDIYSDAPVDLDKLHRYFADLLLNTIKQRCPSSPTFPSICAKLNDFFCTLQEVVFFSDILTARVQQF